MKDKHIQTRNEESGESSSLYEITYLVREEKDRSLPAGIIAKHGGEIEREDALQKIQLSYPIKKEPFAFLGVIRFQADPSRLGGLNADLLLEDRFLRYLITSPVPLEAESRGGESRRTESRGENPSRESRPSGKRPSEARRPLASSSSSHSLSNEALQEKIEEILQ